MQHHILLLTNDPIEAKTFESALVKSKQRFKINWVTQLSEGIERLGKGDIHVIIVNLNLQDSNGISTLDKLFTAVPQTPILTLGISEKNKLTQKVIQHGAQVNLCKDYFTNALLPQVLLNIIQRKQIDEALNQEKLRAEIALNSIHDAVICTDLSAKIDYLNPSAATLTGWSKKEAYGMHINEVFNIVDGATHSPPLNNPIYQVLERNAPMAINAGTLLIRRDGKELPIEDSVSPIRDHKGEMTGVVIVFHDTSIQREMERKMAHLAHHDFLTNLPNRLLLSDRIAQAISLAQRTHSEFAILFLDLDNFKHINDSLGHEIGDKLLQSVSNRLSHCIRSADTLSRQGGDEFVILLSSSQYDLEVTLTANKILRALSLPHYIANQPLHITSSIGISVYPTDGLDAQTLIKNADAAMYSAKATGRNNYKYFRNEMNLRAVERQQLESKLRFALENSEFTLHYQPKLDLASDKVTGVEALLRWHHHPPGIADTKKFIAILEESGLIIPVGQWVLSQACLQAKRWIERGLTPTPVAVNISAIEFHQNNFIDHIFKVLQDTGLDPQYLEIEITESVMMRDATSTANILTQLRDKGVKITLDDFGTGYSSLSYLKQFPVDVIKIDQSFIQDIITSTDEAIIVSAIIGMAHNLKLCVVAEGVENKMQYDLLKNKQCQQGQGLYFSPPLHHEACFDYLSLHQTSLVTG